MTAPRRVVVPNLNLLDHQREVFAAYASGARRMVLKWHRQAGKGLAVLALVAKAAWERPATYMIASPTAALCRENFWDALNPDTGIPYMAVIPEALVIDRNENEMALVMHTKAPGQTSRIVFRSAEDADRLRGPAFGGVILDEFATYASGGEALNVVRIPVERAQGFLVVTSTPKGQNHFYDAWKNAEGAGGWFLSDKTIEDTRGHDGQPIIPAALVAQERAEGQSEEWIQQEYYVKFTSALIGAYYGQALTKAEAEGRIGDYPHRPERRVLTAWDLGMSDATAIVYVQDAGEFLHVIDADEWTGTALPDSISRVQAHGFVFGEHLGPHDLKVRDLSVAGALTREQVAARLGFRFRVVPRVERQQENIDALRRLFPRLRFDRRRAAKVLQALAAYSRDWDAKGKTFRDSPMKSWANHLTDAMHTLARGYREARDPSRLQQRYALTSTGDPWGERSSSWPDRHAQSRTARDW